jgi:hypothetical protein
LVVVVAPCSTDAATGWRVRDFRAADTDRKDVPIVRAPCVIGRSPIRIMNVLAMLFPIPSIDDPQKKLPGGLIGGDFRIHAVE